MQLEHVEDVVLDREELASSLKDFKSRDWNGDCAPFCIEEEIKASMEKIKLHEETTGRLQAEKQILKIFLEKLEYQSVEKSAKRNETIFWSLDMKYIGIASTILNVISKLLA